MHLVLSHRSEKGGGFRSPLRAAHNVAIGITQHVQAAVAYVSTIDNPVIADCARLGIRCEVWSRHDESLPTALPVLDWALKRMAANANLTWRLVSAYFHPKVIWWHGYGVYLGSANLTDAAWNANCEAGVVILESELDDAELRQPLIDFFSDVHSQSIDLDLKVCEEAERLLAHHLEIEALRRELKAQYDASETGGLLARQSLSTVTKVPRIVARRNSFLSEWRNTLTLLENIQRRLAEPKNLPKWVKVSVSPGIHTDQFLHAFYYDRVRDGQRYPVEEVHRENKANPEAAIKAAIEWWRNTPGAPSSEEMVFNDWAPVHRELLTPERLTKMTEREFVRVARRVHSINGFAKRRRPEELAPDEVAAGERIELETKRDLHCSQLYYLRNLLNWQPPQLLQHLLFGGSVADTPSRLFDCIHDPRYKIPGLDISSLGELVGWGLPNDFPPRNDRTNKALRALGFDVHVRSPNRE